MNGRESSLWQDNAVQAYIADVARHPPLSKSQENLLADRLQSGDPEARQRLIEANLRFVIFVAQQYANRGVQFADLISAGNLGLIVAAEKFDPNRGFRFISYAVWWIRHEIHKVIRNHGLTIRAPADRIYLRQHILRCTEDLTQSNQGGGHEDRAPINEEVARECGITVEHLEETLVMGKHILSLNYTPDGGDGRESMHHPQSGWLVWGP